jgi:hypothetical protein
MACDSDSYVNHMVLLHAAICNMGQTALLPLRREACCGFFVPKNPTASVGFELAFSLYYNIPSAACTANPRDEQVMLETYRGP